MIPIFTSNHSIGDSILTLESPDKDIIKNPDKELPKNRALSIFEIATHHKLDKVAIVETDINGWWKAYKASKDSNVQYCYGIKLTLCANAEDKTPESEKTESNVIIWLLNSQGYKDFVKVYSAASTIFMLDGKRRLDWKRLHEMWSDNFDISIPFYSSFLARNAFFHGHGALPDFQGLKPSFFIQNHSLPQDEILKNLVENYCSKNDYPVEPAHQVYYYRHADAEAHLCLCCALNRSTFDKPELGGYSSEQFSFEAYEKKLQ